MEIRFERRGTTAESSLICVCENSPKPLLASLDVLTHMSEMIETRELLPMVGDLRMSGVHWRLLPRQPTLGSQLTFLVAMRLRLARDRIVLPDTREFLDCHSRLYQRGLHWPKPYPKTLAEICRKQISFYRILQISELKNSSSFQKFANQNLFVSSMTLRVQNFGKFDNMLWVKIKLQYQITPNFRNTKSILNFLKITFSEILYMYENLSWSARR